VRKREKEKNWLAAQQQGKEGEGQQGRHVQPSSIFFFFSFLFSFLPFPSFFFPKDPDLNGKSGVWKGMKEQSSKRADYI